jgi:hypothetical protein
MRISLTTFVSDLQHYLTKHPDTAGDETQRSLTALANRTFDNAKEAKITLEEFVQPIQKSNNEELKGVVQRLFNQAIQRLHSGASTEASPGEQQHCESTNAKTEPKTVIQNLDQGSLAHIFGFLDPKDQRSAWAVCQTWREALRCRQYWDLTDDPKVTQLLSSFGMSIPPQDISSEKKDAAWNDIYAKVSIILKGIHGSEALSDEEKKPFFEKTSQEIVNDSNLWLRLLHTAYEHSLVTPFLNGKNHGPDLSNSTTLAKKAEAIRNHLKEKGDTYTVLDCSHTGMLCFPIEFCSLKNLQGLYVSANQITALPKQIGLLKELQELIAFCNQITALPKEIGLLVALQQLHVDKNQITALPKQIGLLTKLWSLNASSNQISSLPQGITGFSQNISINLRNNPLTTIPKFPENIHVDM